MYIRYQLSKTESMHLARQARDKITSEPYIHTTNTNTKKKRLSLWCCTTIQEKLKSVARHNTHMYKANGRINKLLQVFVVMRWANGNRQIRGKKKMPPNCRKISVRYIVICVKVFVLKCFFLFFSNYNDLSFKTQW